jgi:CHAD domain-containing protein
MRSNEFLKSRRLFKTGDEETLHNMRIALKQLRYAVEAALPVLGPSHRQEVRSMQKFQKLMGEARDLELLRDKLEKWAAKEGRKVAVVPALDQLAKGREELLKRVVKALPRLDKSVSLQVSRPKVEKTMVITKPARVAPLTQIAEAVPSGHDERRDLQREKSPSPQYS